MNLLAASLERALDPVALARRGGMDPDPWQADVLRSSHPRVLLNCSRQSGKSSVSSFKAVHAAEYEPGSLILLLSPSLRQSLEVFKKCMAAHRAVGRASVVESENASTLILKNGSRIVSLPGTSATVRGYSGVRLLIVDEASRVQDELIGAIRPMLAVSGGSIIALSTPAGKRGWWWDAWESGGSTWKRVKITAQDCPRITAEFLDEERRALGDWRFKQEYEGEFVEAAEQMFTEEQIRYALDGDFDPL